MVHKESFKASPYPEAGAQGKVDSCTSNTERVLTVGSNIGWHFGSALQLALRSRCPHTAREEKEREKGRIYLGDRHGAGARQENIWKLTGRAADTTLVVPLRLVLREPITL